MPRFYFHVSRNGQKTEDEAGRSFAHVKDACRYAIEQTPGVLSESLQIPNTYVTTEICDERGTICVVRGTIVLEHRRSHSAGRP